MLKLIMAGDATSQMLPGTSSVPLFQHGSQQPGLTKSPHTKSFVPAWYIPSSTDSTEVTLELHSEVIDVELSGVKHPPPTVTMFWLIPNELGKSFISSGKVMPPIRPVIHAESLKKGRYNKFEDFVFSVANFEGKVLTKKLPKRPKRGADVVAATDVHVELGVDNFEHTRDLTY